MAELNNKQSPPQCPNTVTVRKNPHRRARPTPYSVAPGSSSSKLPEVNAFPMEEIMSMPVSEPASMPSPIEPSAENLKVYLRIRPLLPAKSSGTVSSASDRNRAKSKNVWPQNLAKRNPVVKGRSEKSSFKACIEINDSNSVTLLPPPNLQECKRIKSETYGGFSHVFSPESSQVEVYERMVSPMVEDFLKGKSRMLAALGPSGSGKTHTVFGCPREPGVVPLVLKNIFKCGDGGESESSRLFYISILEIYSERGKGEKLHDLASEGCELSLQQSNVKGMNEVMVSDASEAESLIARAMLRRTTAVTNSNSQSSRSQCIINICHGPKKLQGKANRQSHNAIFTIIDLAGAEREKKTRNQGARLLESNFINNTSMVFGLCLRSLLEHQKNPKKPLQKHFQNSMLTRYLRDYLEGKKCMTLILTAKSGKDDYLDTSYLLRQASPYTKIKFNNADEALNVLSNKRHYQASVTVQHPKRAKLVKAVGCVDVQSIEEQKLPVEDPLALSETDCCPLKSGCFAESERKHIIMSNFAKAIWDILKQYNEKLKGAEIEIQNLKESVGIEKKRNLELEKKLNDYKACCTCCREGNIDADLKTGVESKEHKCHDALKVQGRADDPDKNQSISDVERECVATVQCCETDVVNASHLCIENSVQPYEGRFVVDSAEEANESERASSIDKYRNSTAGFTGVGKDDPSSTDSGQQLSLNNEEPPNPPVSCEEEDSVPPSLDTFERSYNDPRLDASDKLAAKKYSRKLQSTSLTPKDLNALDINVENEIQIISLDPLPLPQDASSTKASDLVHAPRGETRFHTSRNSEKPKRRLMPASSVLLREFKSLDVTDEIEKPKVSRGKKKLSNDRTITPGSLSLLRMLQSNLHL